MKAYSNVLRGLGGIAVVVLATGCLELDSPTPAVIDVVGLPLETDSAPRGIYMVHDAAELRAMEQELAIDPNDVNRTPDQPQHARYVIYMNRNGGTFSPGLNDSRTNRSTIPNQTVTIPAWGVADADWNGVMSCMTDLFAPFDVDITDVDPGSTPHIESVVAGRPQLLGLDPNVGGVSPFTSDCSIINNSIVYTFAEIYGNNYRVVCEVAAQEVAHSFGLDHQFLCSDPMTYLTGCGSKTFQNVDAQCGEDSPRQCACGGSTQNSVRLLQDRIGIGTGDGGFPVLNILFPTEGASVAPGFGVYVDANDGGGIRRVELYVDGALVGTDETAPYSFGTARNLSPGAHQLMTKAVDLTDNETTTIINVIVDPSADPSEPFDPEASDDLVGGCSTPGTGAGGSGGFLLLFAAFCVARRRRR